MTTTYDDLPYDTGAFWAVHPDRLAVAAHLRGLHPAPIERCSVLELGCGCGENLLPMAAYLPQSRFVGLDLSGRQIDQGLQATDELGLTNLRLVRQDILDFDGEGGPFDYILCHGVFSWVHPPVRAKILDICRRHLAGQAHGAPYGGVALISHNVYPGWHLNLIIRDAMRLAVRPLGADPPTRQVDQALGFLNFLCQNPLGADSPYGMKLRQAAQFFRDRPATYVYHEYLETVNSPEYFEDFAAAAARSSLQYLGDACLNDVRSHLSQETLRTLETAWEDPVRQEQIVDFLTGRAFRYSLLCHGGVRLDRTIGPQAVEGLWLSSACRPEGPAPDGGAKPAQVFITSAGHRVTVEDPLLRSALTALNAAMPTPLRLGELAALAGPLGTGVPPASAPPGDAPPPPGQAQGPGTEPLERAMLASARVGLVDLHSWNTALGWPPPPRPTAWPLVRWQAGRSAFVVTPWHRTVQLDAVGRAVLPLLDGRKDRGQIVSELERLVREGRLALPAGPDGPPPELPHVVQAVVEGLARVCLVAPG